MNTLSARFFHAMKFYRAAPSGSEQEDDALGWVGYYAKEIIAGPRCECGAYLMGSKDSHAYNCGGTRYSRSI